VRVQHVAHPGDLRVDRHLTHAGRLGRELRRVESVGVDGVHVERVGEVRHRVERTLEEVRSAEHHERLGVPERAGEDYQRVRARVANRGRRAHEELGVHVWLAGRPARPEERDVRLVPHLPGAHATGEVPGGRAGEVGEGVEVVGRAEVIRRAGARPRISVGQQAQDRHAVHQGVVHQGVVGVELVRPGRRLDLAPQEVAAQDREPGVGHEGERLGATRGVVRGVPRGNEGGDAECGRDVRSAVRTGWRAGARRVGAVLAAGGGGRQRPGEQRRQRRRSRSPFTCHDARLSRLQIPWPSRS
jgi:hypothetical protein